MTTASARAARAPPSGNLRTGAGLPMRAPSGVSMAPVPLPGPGPVVAPGPAMLLQVPFWNLAVGHVAAAAELSVADHGRRDRLRAAGAVALVRRFARRRRGIEHEAAVGARVVILEEGPVVVL